MRPPYFLDEDDFLKCIKCPTKDCKNVCETQIIKLDKNYSPYLDFSLGGCTYCDECAKSCPEEVLKVEYKKNINVKISIDEMLCLSWSKIMCFSCKDPCLDNAIEFTGLFYPKITDDCTSCGFCIKYCPTNAIVIKED